MDYVGKSDALVAPAGADADPTDPPDSTQGDELHPRELTDPGQLLVSTTPLRAPESGQLQPVDPTLVPSGADSNDLQPDNATVEASMPTALADGIQLHGLGGITVTPSGADQADTRQLVGPDKLFYGGVDTDTDFIASSTPTGVEAYWQLRSVDSPTSQSLHLDLPQGVSIASDGAGGATISDSEGPIASVHAPTATDADGTPVPVQMHVDGDELRVDVALGAGDFRLPLLVDPIIDDYNWTTTPADCPTPNGSGAWHWEAGPAAQASNFGGGCNTSGVTGIVDQGLSGSTHSFTDGAWAQWVWTPPANTYISSAYYFRSRHAAQGSCGIFGIYNPTSSTWQANNGPYNQNFTSPQMTTPPGQQPNFCASWASYGMFFDIPTAPPDGNQGVVRIQMSGAGTRAAASQLSTEEAKFWVGDRHSPTVSYTPPASSGTWTDDGGQTHTDTVSGADQGLGVKSFWQSINGTIAPSPPRPCNGIRGASACTSPTGWSTDFDYQLPEGKSTVSYASFDQAGNASSGSDAYTALIDRSAPMGVEIDGGTLKADNTAIADRATYTVSVSAHDGAASPDSAMRSGVRSVRLYVDDSSDALAEHEFDCGGGASACPADASYTFNLDLGDEGQTIPDGEHTITLKAVDEVGHTTESAPLSIYVRADTDAPQVETTYGTESEGEVPLEITVTDGGEADDMTPEPGFGSGVDEVQVMDDDTVLSTVPQTSPCQAGACSITTSITVPVNTQSHPHELHIRAWDKNGNVHNIVGGTAKRYTNFGYNDGFVNVGSVDMDEMFRRAVDDGGASVLRFPVDWCSLVPHGSSAEANNPHDVDWDNPTGNGAAVKQLFDRARNYNEAHGGTPVHMLPVLIDAPVWARPQAYGGEGASCLDPDSPPAAAYDAYWERFVGSILDEFGPAHGDAQHPLGDDDYGLIGVELWNEPNLNKFWPSGIRSAGRFAQLTEEGSDAVTSRNLRSSVKVVPGGLSPAGADPVTFTRQFLDALFADGTGPHGELDDIDAVSLHLYADNVARDVAATADLKEELRLILAQYDGYGQSIDPRMGTLQHWVTEVGARSDPDPNHPKVKHSVPDQERRVCDAYLQLRHPDATLTRPVVDMLLVNQLYDASSPKWGTWGSASSASPKSIFSALASLASGGGAFCTWGIQGL